MNNDHQRASQIAFAKHLGFSQTTIAAWERGKRTVREQNIKIISDVCYVDEQWLRDGWPEIPADKFEAFIQDIRKTHDLSPEGETFMRKFFALPEEGRASMLFLMDRICDKSRNESGRLKLNKTLKKYLACEETDAIN